MTDFIYQFKIDERVCDDLIEYHKNKNEYKILMRNHFFKKSAAF